MESKKVVKKAIKVINNYLSENESSSIDSVTYAELEPMDWEFNNDLDFTIEGFNVVPVMVVNFNPECYALPREYRATELDRMMVGCSDEDFVKGFEI